MIDTVLFDLDGTLLPMDQDEFVNKYLGLMAKKMAPHGYEPNHLMAGIWAGISAMVQNTGEKTNESAFWDDFCHIFGVLCVGSLNRLHHPQLAILEIRNILVVGELLDEPSLDIGVASTRTLYLLEQVKQFVSIFVEIDVLLHTLVGQTLGGVGSLGGAVGLANYTQAGEISL